VVDDVCTTGSTLRAAAVALRRWGAGSVVAVVVTAVPPHDR
jgi:predicted amidophosphoribosyltransferase